MDRAVPQGRGPAGPARVAEVELREISAMAELRPLEAMQREVWGVEDVEVVPASAMRAAVHAGGMVVGAYSGGDVVGFAFGFVATPHGRGMQGVGLHSHMAAVLPEFRGAGVGRRLKRFQASWCAARGLRWISWTFDPLRRENARFNLAVLGARCYEYLHDFYGPMPGTLGGGIESDRLLAVWDVTAQARQEAGAGDGGPRAPGRTDREGDLDEQAVWLLPPGETPAVPSAAEVDRATAGVGRLRVATPDPAHDVFSHAERAEAWRAAHRATLARALERGWAVVGFEGAGYVLERTEGAQ
ncbi:MAG TPA: GNAT family N-acetyltransferase [Trueperaceae bacterium]|nr:GNAT family N-acetyltransferase [Trueperaceae bacterium]